MTKPGLLPVIDPRVDAFIDALHAWQQSICREVRALVRSADPDVRGTIKRTTQPYFFLDRNICALLAAKDHVNVFLYDGGIVPDPEGIVTSGHGNKTARTVAVRQCGRASRSVPRHSLDCSGRSSPTTGPVAGTSSNRGAERGGAGSRV